MNDRSHGSKTPSDRGGAEGVEPPAPMRLDSDEEYADSILQLRVAIAINMAARARESMSVFQNYADPEDLVREVMKRDDAWLDAHPREEGRDRRAVEGEFLGLEAVLPPFEWVRVTRESVSPIIPKDPVGESVT